MEYTKNFTISGWSCHTAQRTPEEQVREWHELGLTVMIAHSNKKDWERTHALLDEAEKFGIKLIIEDWDANEANLRLNGEDYYRECMNKLIDEFGSHPANFGFYITDEPSADNIDVTLKACAINQKL